MYILDVHIVRITELTAETVGAADQYVAIDSDAYLDGYPKKLTLLDLAKWVISILFSLKMCNLKGLLLRDGEPYQITFDEEFETDYIIIPSYVHSDTQVGLTITNELSTGFEITANGSDITLDIMVVPITPLN
jgi:hypothetical protein